MTNQLKWRGTLQSDFSCFRPPRRATSPYQITSATTSRNAMTPATMRNLGICFLALSAVLLTVTAGQADVVTLPTTYDNLEPSAANATPTATVGGLTFSDFTMVTGSGGPNAMGI